VSVLQFHNNASRDGVYVDARITAAAAATMHADTTFANTAIMGPVYAQPLYLAGANGAAGDAVLVATAQNRVYSLSASTGAANWNVQLGTAVASGAPGLCGIPLNPLGITGTPVIDAATRTMFLSAMTSTTGNVPRHMLHALALDTNGTERAGWPIDVTATATSGGTAFNAPIQNQRAALALLGGKVFVPFGGHIGDCLGYHGWIVGVTTTGTPQVSAWATTAIAGGIWGSSGIASDGTSLYVTTGNTKANANSGASGSSPGVGNWGGGEAVIKFPTTLLQPPPTQTTDYFFPSNWTSLDMTDADLGGVGPVLFRAPGATPSDLVMALGKDGKAYLLNRANLGGMNVTPLAGITVASGAIISSAVAYTSTSGTYVVFRGNGVGCPNNTTGGLTAIKISATSPPALSIAWCAGTGATSSPAVSMSNAQGANTIIWYVGNDARLHGLNGDTGASVRADTTALGTVKAHQTPIVANGRIFVASDTRIFAFTP
jgi:outer membrane protein assembly factor BamB